VAASEFKKTKKVTQISWMARVYYSNSRQWWLLRLVSRWNYN